MYEVDDKSKAAVVMPKKNESFKIVVAGAHPD